jgi:hypothetical protein
MTSSRWACWLMEKRAGARGWIDAESSSPWLRLLHNRWPMQSSPSLPRVSCLLSSLSVQDGEVMKRVLFQFGGRERPANDQQASEREEPRTGVVRKVTGSPERGPSRASESGVRARGGATPSGPSDTRLPATRLPATRRAAGAKAESGAWRCLEWGERSSERPVKRDSKVSIVHLSTEGLLLSQSGPDKGLTEAALFMQRMAALVAHGLGFEQCRAVCLRNETAALSVSQSGVAKLVAVAGPAAQMPNVLRRAGLE